MGSAAGGDNNGGVESGRRPRSSVLKSFIHRRNQSEGSALFTSPPSVQISKATTTTATSTTTTSSPTSSSQHIQAAYDRLEGRMMPPPPPSPLRTDGFGALGELNQNSQQDPVLRSPRKQPTADDDRRDRSRSPTKSTFGTTLSFKSIAKGTSDARKSRDASPEKPKKTKSATNLAGFLSRPRSTLSLHKTSSKDRDDEAARRMAKDKENRTPPSSTSSADMSQSHAGAAAGGPAPPIYAQFCSQDLGSAGLRGKKSFDGGSGRYGGSEASSSDVTAAKKQRPKSYHPSTAISKHESTQDLRGRPYGGSNGSGGPREPSASERITSKAQRPKLFTAFSAYGSSSKSSTPTTATATKAKTPTESSFPAERTIDPKEIDKHLEAMLDRRNIPENQRYKMRNLADTIKMEFIRQDWAEMAAKEQANEPTSATGAGGGGSSDRDEGSNNNNNNNNNQQSKRSRGRSFTLSRKKDQSSNSPTKKSKGGDASSSGATGSSGSSIGRHFRSKSTDSTVSESRPSSAGSTASNGILSKIKFGQGPGDYVSYLRKVRKPELVEVGKLHKLRLLLRNETVSWTEDFIRQGGMEEIVGLLNRIIAVEWREEHEDALLHENLLCLKALCTTALALQYLHSIQADLFPKLLHMLFDPEKKGPSEFTTRNIITSVMFTYIESAPPAERIPRAAAVLSYLRNPQPKEEDRPLGFVLEMRKDRPYTVWNKEIVSVTKEVFWIFLHHLNVIALPADLSTKGGAAIPPCSTPTTEKDPYAYMQRHFPSERPPVPAAPYVGGVEWDATNYLASHLDLMNAILACTPSAAARNALRSDLRISGMEKVLGGSLRLCKEKFYGCVHEGLRCWVAAAAEDGWDPRDVRYGPPPESRSSSPKKNGNAAGSPGKKVAEPAPRIEMPKLDFGLDNALPRRTPIKERDAWLS